MEIGLANFISFEEYKKKILINNSEDNKQKEITKISQKQNEAEMIGLVRYYENLKGKEEK